MKQLVYLNRKTKQKQTEVERLKLKTMKTAEEIKNAYKNLFEVYANDFEGTATGTFERLVKGWSWIESNNFEKEIEAYAYDEFGTYGESIIESIVKKSAGIVEKPTHKMAELQGQYEELNSIRYDAVKRTYVKY